MGWWFGHRCKYSTPYKAFFQDEWGKGCEIEQMTVHGWGEAYALVRSVKTGQYFGVAIMLRHVPNSYFNFGYKDMDESMGPGIANAPKSMIDRLDRLAPLDDQNDPNGWARGWRARCRANAAARSAERIERNARRKAWRLT